MDVVVQFQQLHNGCELQYASFKLMKEKNILYWGFNGDEQRKLIDGLPLMGFTQYFGYVPFCKNQFDKIMRGGEPKLFSYYKGRAFHEYRRVSIYKNLHNGMWSIRQNGLVIAHAPKFVLGDIICQVSETGRQRVIKEKKKNVHAVINGRIDFPSLYRISNLCQVSSIKKAQHKISYNPYVSDKFILSDGSELKNGQSVLFEEDGAYLIKY